MQLGRHVLGEVHALQAGPGACLFQQCGDVELTSGRMRDHAVGRAGGTDTAGQRAGVDARQADAVVPRHPPGEVLHRAEVGRGRRVLADDHAQRVRRVRLDIVGVRADIADMREGEGDDLAREGRVGHDLLIAGHRGVEAHLADGITLDAETAPP